MPGRSRTPNRAPEQGLRIAPLRLRLLAFLIDLTIFGSAAIAIVGLTIAVFIKAKALRLRLAPVGTRLARIFRGPRSRRARLSINAALVVPDVALRGWQSPGARLLGLRRVDARTGAPVGVRAALVRGVVWRARRMLMDRVFGPFEARERERNAAARESLQPELERIKRRHRHDPEARQAAMMALYREHSLNPFAAYLRSTLPRTAAAIALDAPTILSPRRQTLTDRLAGIAVVVER
jgi:uncharacterized RDD family membrane protein YckC